MPKRRRSKIATLACTFFIALASILALCLGAALPVRAQVVPTFGPLPCPGQSAGYPANPMICTMTIEIFNDDSNHFIFPVLEMGQSASDLWMQAWFSILNTQLGANPFPRNNTYRIYINPAKGIAPGTGVSLTFPMFTALKTIPNPPDPMNPAFPAFSNPGTGQGLPDTFIDWWNGGNIQLYTSPGATSAVQPPSLTNELNRPLTQQKPLTVPWNPGAPPAPTAGGPPTCTSVQSKAPDQPVPPNCEPLTIYVDTSGIGKQGGSQLLEYTLGATNANQAPPRTASWINFWMDTHNVDFDISYVDVAWMPGVMGTFGNDQVGFTGTPQTIDQFKLGPKADGMGGLTAFMNTVNGPNNTNCCWPQYRDTFANLNPPPNPGDPCSNNPVPRVVPCFTYLKFPSPIDVFASLSGGLPPPDFFPVPNLNDWTSGPPAALNAWKPLQTLYNSWITWAGAFNGSGTCGEQGYTPGTKITDWCTAIRAQKAILLANYSKYVDLFNANKCTGTKVTLSDRLLIGHLYGFTPWVESADGIAGHGCASAFNLLQDTPDYCVNLPDTDMPPNPIPPCPTVANPLGGTAKFRNYNNYNMVKTAFDQLNYGPLATPPLPNPGYLFNPWVELIHADPTKPPNPLYGLNMPCSYAYSVDDAQGNVQADGTGFILDISSTVNLENKFQCSPPINIALGYDPNVTPRFFKYAVCKITNTIPNDRVRPVVPGFASFVIAAQNPAGCPIFLWDNVISGKDTAKPILDTNPVGPPLGQMYTFRINGDTTLFPLFTPPFTPQTAPSWSSANHAIIGCKGNSPYSSQIWCCNSAANSGVFVFSQPVIGAAHQSKSYIANTIPAITCTTKTSCDVDRHVGNSTPCNTDF
jgi:hypothetical protein